jgi:putative addiction module killer protein
MHELRHYVTPNGRRPLPDWIEGLRDRQAKARIKTRLDRLADGNFGDHHDVGEGVYELRIDWGPGYRVYCARIGELILLLLCGGDKRTQDKDIKRAKNYFKDYKARSAQRPR